jgi:glutamine amidotransferase
MGNLFSVVSALEAAGFGATITDDADDVAAAPGAVLPGVGAFGDAMAALRKRGLDDALRDLAARGKPLLGVCLGMQLFVTESQEFGRHRGLGLLEGRVVSLRDRMPDAAARVPHIGWSRLIDGETGWDTSPLASIAPSTHAYFVHSYVVEPADAATVVSWTEYGGLRFCSSFQHASLFACQFHPERSGRQYIAVYRAAFQE